MREKLVGWGPVLKHLVTLLDNSQYNVVHGGLLTLARICEVCLLALALAISAAVNRIRALHRIWASS